MLKTYSEWIAENAPDQTVNTESASTEESPSDSRGASARDPPTSRVMCEYHLYRNDGLRQVNRGLVEQISMLKEGLEQAQNSLFIAQCIIARQKEVASIRSKRLHSGQSVQAGPDDNDQRANDRVERDDRAHIYAASPTSGISATSLPDSRAQETSENPTTPPFAREHVSKCSPAAPAAAFDLEPVDEDSCYDADDPLSATYACCSGDEGKKHLELDKPPFVSTTATKIDTSQRRIQDPDTADVAGSEYKQLLALGAPESEDGEWHRRALRQLAQERESRRSSKSESESCASSPRLSRLSFASSVEADLAGRGDDEEEVGHPVTFQALVALREADTDDQLGEWQRQSLKRLSEERERHVCLQRGSTSSVSLSPTNSSTSTHNFSNDEN